MYTIFPLGNTVAHMDIIITYCGKYVNIFEKLSVNVLYK